MNTLVDFLHDSLRVRLGISRRAEDPNDAPARAVRAKQLTIHVSTRTSFHKPPPAAHRVLNRFTNVFIGVGHACSRVVTALLLPWHYWRSIRQWQNKLSSERQTQAPLWKVRRGAVRASAAAAVPRTGRCASMMNDGKRGELRLHTTERNSPSGFAKRLTVKRPADSDNFSTSVSGWLGQLNWLVWHHRKNSHGDTEDTGVL